MLGSPGVGSDACSKVVGVQIYFFKFYIYDRIRDTCGHWFQFNARCAACLHRQYKSSLPLISIFYCDAWTLRINHGERDCRNSRVKIAITEKTKMERHIQRFLNKVSFVSITVATLTLLFLLVQTPETCIPANAPQKPHLRFPISTCDSSPRHYLPLSKKNARLWSSKSWMTQVSSYTQFFTQLYQMGVLKNHSKVLCVSAGAGYEVMALSKMGVEDVTGVELIESLPLVSRADPHNLPFFDGAFDVAFSGHLEEALYPRQYAGEMERTVRKGGLCVVVVDACGEEEVKEIARLFRRSRLLGSSYVTLNGRRMTRIILRTKASA